MLICMGGGGGGGVVHTGMRTRTHLYEEYLGASGSDGVHQSHTTLVGVVGAVQYTYWVSG